MKILLAIDGSKYGEAAAQEIIRRPWPLNSEVRVLSVAHPIPFLPDPLLVLAASHYDSVENEQKRAAQDVTHVAEDISRKAPGLKVTTEVLEGSPKKMIVEEAERWGADLIMMGSHGYGPTTRFLLGSVAQAVALHAPCSVEIVRWQPPAGN